MKFPQIFTIQYLDENFQIISRETEGLWKSLIFVRIKKIVQKQILRTFSDLYVTCDCSDILLNYPFYLPN